MTPLTQPTDRVHFRKLIRNDKWQFWRKSCLTFTNIVGTTLDIFLPCVPKISFMRRDDVIKLSNERSLVWWQRRNQYRVLQPIHHTQLSDVRHSLDTSPDKSLFGGGNIRNIWTFYLLSPNLIRGRQGPFYSTQYTPWTFDDLDPCITSIFRGEKGQNIIK